MKPVTEFKFVLPGFSISVIGILGLSFLDGYHPFFNFLTMLPLYIVFGCGSIFLGISCLFMIGELIFQRKPFMHFLIGWIILVILFLKIPGVNASVAGSMTALYFAGLQQVETEGRLLIQRCASEPNYCGEITDIPLAIQRVHPDTVMVSNQDIYIGKFRMFDDYGGFKILSPAKVVPGIKVRDGFFWTDSRFR
jgi:hypothetical protein